jgi:hypothetical protein
LRSSEDIGDACPSAFLTNKVTIASSAVEDRGRAFRQACSTPRKPVTIQFTSIADCNSQV